MPRMEKFESFESKCPTCLYFDVCNKRRKFDCDHYLNACDESAWYEDEIEEDRKVFAELWSQYEKEYCD